MAVVIDSGPVSATQRLADVPLDRWRELVSTRRSFCAVNLPYDCRELLHFVNDAPDMLGPLGYTDVTDFLKRGLELDPDMVEWALQGLQRLKPDEPIPFSRAIELGKHGGDRKSERAKNQGHPITLIRGTQSAYLLARLDRDHPALAARVRSGELKAKTAARLAGIIHEKTILEQLDVLWLKASPDDRLTFLRSIRLTKDGVA